MPIKQLKHTDHLRYSIAVIYLWFGALKFFVGFSPAERIAKQTIHCLTFGLIPDRLSVILLALWECLIGLLLLNRKWARPALCLLFVHLILTFTPFLIFPHDTFQRIPFSFTLIGQYIVKNVILICAARVIWYTDPSLGSLKNQF